MTVAPKPRIVRARRSGRFVLEVANDGNLPVDVTLEATDVERSTKASFAPQQLRLPAGTAAPVLLHVRGPRMITGAEADRPVQVVATACRADLPPDGDPGPDSVAVEPQTVELKLRQRPLVSRGVLTAMILLGIVGLWAAVFLLGLTKVFSNDPMTKSAPASSSSPPRAARPDKAARRVSATPAVRPTARPRRAHCRNPASCPPASAARSAAP